MHRVIRAIQGPLEGEEFLLDEVTGIGRSGDLAIQLIGASVSRNHAELRVEPDGTTTLHDLGSKNGTYFQGEPVQRVTLKSGDSFEIGNSSFLFEEREGALPSTDSQLRLLSGPAEEVTQLFPKQPPPSSRTRRTTTMPLARATSSECEDPLHDIAKSNQWRFCPVCGRPPA